MRNRWVLGIGIGVLLSFFGCASLGDLFLTDQQKQWKAEGRNIKTGLFDEPYSGKSFQEKSELESFFDTAEYKAAVANHTAWENAYTREQRRVEEENRKIDSRNQAAWSNTERRAQSWVASVKQDGLQRRLFDPGALFEEQYNPNMAFTELVAVFLVNNKEVARNVFTCKKELRLENQVGKYDPRVKY